MSRIYEALQRADLERKAAHEPEVEQDAEQPVVVHNIEPPPPLKANVVQIGRASCRERV